MRTDANGEPPCQMRDIDIRRELFRELASAFADDPETLIVDELSLDRGTARIDVAVINGHLAGYELKSPRDTLARLGRQADVYAKVLDLITVVAGERHALRAEAAIPRTWGLAVARSGGTTGVTLDHIRAAALNRSVEGAAVARLLWRDEALDALEKRGLAVGFRSKPRRVLTERLASAVPLDELCDEVRRRLRQRATWRAYPRRASHGESCLRAAT